MLLYFTLGILLISLGIPILENLSSIIQAWSQYIVYIFAFKIYTIKQKMNIKDDEQEQTKVLGFTSAIGTEIPSEEYFEQEQEE